MIPLLALYYFKYIYCVYKIVMRHSKIYLMRNIISIAVLAIFFSQSCIAQKIKITDEIYNKSGASKLTFIDSLSQATQLAKQDIANGIPFILLQSGISPIKYSTDKQ